MDLFNLPIKTLETGILPYLEWNDLLQLRLVSKEVKNVIHGYLKEHPELAPEIQINKWNCGRNLQEFVEMGIPCSKIFLNDSYGYWFDNHQEIAKALDQFLTEYGSMITHVRVRKLTLVTLAYGFSQEYQFWEGLTNLQSVTAELIEFEQDFETVADQPLDVPWTFMGLRNLKIGRLSDNGLDERKHLERLKNFLAACKMLEHISLPLIPAESLAYGEFMDKLLLDLLTTRIRVRADARNSANQLPNLKSIDLGHTRFSSNFAAKTVQRVASFGQLCGTCVDNQVKMLNVHVEWLRESQKKLPENLGRSVLSTVASVTCQDFDDLEFIWNLEMPFLENLSIESISSFPKYYLESGRPANWSMNLTGISVYEVISVQDFKSLFHFFNSFPRLTEAGFYGLPSMWNVEIDNWECLNSTLKKLTLKGWNGSNKALVKLCEGLNNLNEVILLESKSNNRNQRSPFLFSPRNKYPVMLNIAEFQQGINRKGRKFRVRKLKKNVLFIGVLNLIMDTVLRVKTDPKQIKLVTCVGFRSLFRGSLFAELVQMVQKDSFVLESMDNVSPWKIQMLAKMFISAAKINVV